MSRSFGKAATFQRATVLDPNAMKPGLNCELYHGQWTRLPGFGGMRAVETVVSDRMDLSPFAEEQLNFGLRFTGFLRVPRTEVYRFYLESDDGAKLTIADEVVVDNDGVHGITEVGAEIALEAGWHPIELLYFQGVGDRGLRVEIEGANRGKSVISPSLLAH